MYYANDEQGIRVFIDAAEKKNSYFCPACGRRMIIKRGKIKCHHFAHEAKSVCDPWYNGNEKSLWHQEMQSMFLPEEQEVVVWNENGTVFHVADAIKQSQEGPIVYEFQHSPISGDDFIERSSYYLNLGYRLVWIFDYCTKSRPKNILFTEEQYIYKYRTLYRFVWPGRDRVKLFDSYDMSSFLSECECNNGGKLRVYFFVSTGLGEEIHYEYDIWDYEKWEFVDPFRRENYYIKPYFSFTDDLSDFYASAYKKEIFEKYYVSF